MTDILTDTADTCSTLDLLDAITEHRVRNPELRSAVLGALRLATSSGHAMAGRLYCLRFDGEITAIIAHGDAQLSEEDDRRLMTAALESREPVMEPTACAHPLGKEKRAYGVLILEEASHESAAFLADLILQWTAVADFVNTQKAELIDENFQLREEIRMQFSDDNIIGTSGVFRHVVESACRVAASAATVLIQGETGTGKELLARLIHAHSPRTNHAFVSINCGALSESLLETELFGHVKGAFTGAVADHKGRFEVADHGTIFLDEIGEISQAMQVRLLRVLQEMEVVRVGDTKTRKLDVRVVAATNRDLEAEVAAGNFRADLYYRLNVVHLQMPALRQRPEDIPSLVEHFLSVYCQRNCKYIESVSRQVLDTMKSYAWPGNVRELENCIEKMVVMAPGNDLTPDLLPMALVAYVADQQPANEPVAQCFETQLRHWMQAETNGVLSRGGLDLYETVRTKWERYLFEIVLDTTKNNKSKAARLLGITRNTLNSRLENLSQVKREWTVE